ncbi:MAG: RNA polymerase sigma factor [Saprospiraceae bacterium]
MTNAEFQTIVTAARNGQPQAFNRFFRQLYEDCKGRLLRYVPHESDAEEAFAEAVYKFWKIFVVEEKPLPQSNLKGYVFTMAKFACLDAHKKRQKHPTISDEVLQMGNNQPSNETDEEAKSQRENYQLALRRGIAKLGERCRRIFEFMLANDSLKPREVWQQLGYNNARTFSSVKFDCQKKLKVKVAVELEQLL